MQSTARQKKNRKKSRRREFTAVGIFVLIAAVILGIWTLRLEKEQKSCEAKEAALEQQILDESHRAEDLTEQSLFMQTREFIEKIARERLGLVKPGENVVRPDE